mmetsp:Transcript_27906/g.31260  ORF Transcript_27906/g.31260 Transcript_27906/m.31260 type:complete len:96 (+) Transcript_27906:12-299(+)
MVSVISYFTFLEATGIESITNLQASSGIESTSISNESRNLVYLLLMFTAKPVLPPLHLHHTKILTVTIIGFFLITTNIIRTSMMITITITSSSSC